MKKAFTLYLAAVMSILLCAAIHGSAQNASSGKSIVELKTVVIDAGHGGHDPGACNGKYQEKDITLAVAKLLGTKIKTNYPGVKVIYTRDTDKFVKLHERANIANKNNADLFISIHINSAANKSARGHETFVMGQSMNESNMEVCKLENSVITLEDDYTSNYQGFDPNDPESYIIFSLLQYSHLEQSLDFATAVQKHAGESPVANNRGVKQDNFLVLWKCTMPAVLIELGFLSNSNDLKALTNKENQDRMALNIYKAFKEYKKRYDTEIYIPTEEETAAVRAANASSSGSVNTDEDGKFGIQIFAGSKKLKSSDKSFKGWSAKCIQSNGKYKYYIGPFSTRDAAAGELKKVRKSFPEAYIISL